MQDILFGIDENETDIDDLKIVDGDFVIGESTLQHQRHLLLAEKGDYKQDPTIGVGIGSFLLDDDVEGMLREVNIEFLRDGMNVTKVGMTKDGKLEIDADYE